MSTFANDPDQAFEVRQTRAVLYRIAAVFLLLFVAIAADIPSGRFTWSVNIALLAGTLLPGIGFLLKARLNVCAVRIDKNGIQHNGRHITNWDQFHEARIVGRQQVNQVLPQTVLQIEYNRPGTTEPSRYEALLETSQDHPAEAILEAIAHFSGRRIHNP